MDTSPRGFSFAGLGYRNQLFVEEQFRMLKLHFRRYSAIDPVLHALCATVFRIVAKQLGNLGRATVIQNDFCVRVFSHHE